MSRYARRKDKGHGEIVSAFRQLGCSVVILDATDAGVPDLAVGCAGRTYLVEVKPDTKLVRHMPSEAQVNFAKRWKGGPVHLVRCVEGAGLLVQAWRTGLQTFATVGAVQP